jgi:hypothetical protein
MIFPVVSADSDHRLLSDNPSGCAEVSQLYECARKASAWAWLYRCFAALPMKLRFTLATALLLSIVSLAVAQKRELATAAGLPSWVNGVGARSEPRSQARLPGKFEGRRRD